MLPNTGIHFMHHQGLFFSLFTEKFQVKFIVLSGVLRVVQRCFESGCEVEPMLVKSIYRLPYRSDRVIPVVSADLFRYH